MSHKLGEFSLLPSEALPDDVREVDSVDVYPWTDEEQESKGAMKAQVVDIGKVLTTVKFTSGADEMVRNFVNGDHEMLTEVIESTQTYFLSRRYKPAELKQKLVEMGPELGTEREQLVLEIITELGEKTLDRLST